MAIKKYCRIRNYRILDLGCGYGRISTWLIQESAASVVGIDTSRKMIALAKQQEKLPSLSFICGDILDIPFGEPFDTIVCIWVMQHIIDDNYLRHALDRLRELLTKSGQLILIERVRSEGIDELESGMPNWYIRRRKLEDYQLLLNQAGFSIRSWQPLRSNKNIPLIDYTRRLFGKKIWTFNYISKLDICMRKELNNFSWADIIFDCI